MAVAGNADTTTKKCPKCGNAHLGLIRSQNIKVCSDCDLIISGYLDEGQKELK